MGKKKFIKWWVPLVGFLSIERRFIDTSQIFVKKNKQKEEYKTHPTILPLIFYREAFQTKIVLPDNVLSYKLYRVQKMGNKYV